MGADRGGAAALEFALVSVPFIGLVLGLFIVAYNFFLQESVDFALSQAVRRVQLGQVPSSYTAADFTGKVFCPALIAFAPCTNVAVTITPVADYYTAAVTAAPTGGQYAANMFCIGAPGQAMFARVVYVLPNISQFWAYTTQATVNGASGNVIVSTAAFANENPSGTPAAQATGC